MSTLSMNGAQIIIKSLVDQGVEVVFGYPGGAVLPIYDELFKQNKIRHVLFATNRGCPCGGGLCPLNRQGWRCPGDLRPGATNAVTGLTDALMDPSLLSA